MDNAVTELVYDKTDLRKAYNYYNNKRDPEQFRFLEENYGIGQPTEVEFIPLIRKHVDALIGEYLDVPILPKVSCKDSKTINNIFRDKQLKINREFAKVLQEHLTSYLLDFINQKDHTDGSIKEQLDTLKEDINDNFVSEYEMAGQNIIEYIIQSRNIDLKNKLKLLLIDLLVTGYTFYRVIPSSSETNINIEVLNPLDVFPDYNYDSPYIKDSHRVVVRKYLTKQLVFNKYGKKLTYADRKKLDDMWAEFTRESGSYFVIGQAGRGTPMTDGIRAGQEITPTFPDEHWRNRYNTLITVYEIEWITTDSNFKQLRYSGVRIGEEIYIINGKDEVTRSIDSPDKCGLSVNGVYFNNRSSEPYSLVIACMSIQDKYDLLHFYRDKLIANSGSVGDWINLPTLPAELGSNLPERLAKWLAYKKQGLGLLDTSQEGLLNTGQAPLNQIYNGFDDTVKVQAVQAILLAIDSLENTASSITGVFRERLNGIQQHDAVTNIKIGANNSFTITKLWHFQMDLLTREMLIDALNCAKKVYDKGLTGTIILGNKLLKVFTALPKYYSFTDFDIHIVTSTDIIKEMELIKAVVPDLIKSGLVGPDILVEIMAAKGLTEIKDKVNKSMKKQKAENNLIQQLSQQLQQMQQELLQTLKALQQSEQKVQSLNEAKIQLETLKMKLEHDINVYNAKTERDFKENKSRNDTKRTEIELLLLRDGNPYNDEVTNI